MGRKYTPFLCNADSTVRTLHLNRIFFRTISAVTRYSPLAAFTMLAKTLTILFPRLGEIIGGRPSLLVRNFFLTSRVIVLLSLSSNTAISEGLFPSDSCHRFACMISTSVSLGRSLLGAIAGVIRAPDGGVTESAAVERTLSLSLSFHIEPVPAESKNQSEGPNGHSLSRGWVAERGDPR